MTAEEKKKSAPRIKSRTLQELGMSLPIGIRGAGGVDRSLAIRPFSLREEKEIGRMRDRTQEGNIANTVTSVLSVMLLRFGEHDFADMREKAKLAAISQAPMGDVYYAYIMVRREALGPEVPLQVRCPACRAKAEIEGNLDTLEVRTVEADADALWSYELASPLQVRGGAVKRLDFGVPKWFSIERLPSQRGMNFGAAKGALIYGSMVGNDAGIVLTEDDADGLSKRDVERLARLMDSHHLGPNMAIEAECPKCKEEIRSSIDWGYDSFFSVSSP